MPTPLPYRRHRVSGRPDRAYTVIASRRIYLGAFDSEESRRRLRELELEAAASPAMRFRGRRDVTVLELCAAFWLFAEVHYRLPSGKPSSEISNYKSALRFLRENASDAPVTEFGPLRLKAVRQAMIDAGISRGVCNASTNRIRRVFRWGVEEEIVPPGIAQALDAVSPLLRGRTTARETDPILPVIDAHVDAIEPFVSRQVWSLVRLQRLTGARPGELLGLRPCDLDLSGELWEIRPAHHKTAHHGHSRILLLGPRAQKVIAPWLAGRSPAAPLFSPAEAESERRANLRAARKTRPGQGNEPGTNRQPAPKRKPGPVYTKDSYRHAVIRACKRAGIPQWSPNRLRHTAGTHIRRDFGPEAAQVILGHSNLSTTEIYAERNLELAKSVISRIG